MTHKATFVKKPIHEQLYSYIQTLVLFVHPVYAQYMYCYVHVMFYSEWLHIRIYIYTYSTCIQCKLQYYTYVYVLQYMYTQGPLE